MKRALVTFMVAIFATVVFAQTKTEVKTAELPKCVPDYITNHMKGYNIDKAFKMDNKGEITYNITVIKGKEKHVLIFDKACKVVKNENLSEPVTPKKSDAPAQSGNPPQDQKKPLPPVKNNEPATSQPKK